MDFSLYGLLEAWQIQSASVEQGQSLNSLFIIYVVVCFFIKRPVFLLAFLLPEMMFNMSLFDSMAGWHLNAIEFIIYSYVFAVCHTKKSKIACFIICYTAIHFGIDSYCFGVDGVYGERETFIYKNISLINTCAHLFFVSSLISIRRIRNNLRSFIDSIMRITANSDYMCIYWYNVNKIKQPNQIQ